MPTLNNVRIGNCTGYAFAGIFANEIFSSAKPTLNVKNCAKGAIDAITFGYKAVSFANLYIESVNFHAIRVQNLLQFTKPDLSQLESTIVSCDQEKPTILINVTICNSIFKFTLFPQIVPS